MFLVFGIFVTFKRYYNYVNTLHDGTISLIVVARFYVQNECRRVTSDVKTIFKTNGVYIKKMA